MKKPSKFMENPRHVELFNLSVLMRKKKKEGKENAKTQNELEYWADVRINDLIMLHYSEQAGTKDFRTFSAWHEAGFKIKRGEKGWIIWAQKRSSPVPGQEPQAGEVVSEYRFFPTCYLFNVNQVEPFKSAKP